nr:YccF family protein [uncultured Cohaesibacter sp.]
MRFAGNVIWFVLGGFFISIIWLLGAALSAVSIVGLPLSRACFEMAKLAAFPFGKDVVHVRELDAKEQDASMLMVGALGTIVNVIWACTFGITLFLSYLAAGFLNCITIIGIPFGLQAFKLAGLSFWPVGRRVVSKELAQAARNRNAELQLDKIRAAH